MDTVLRFGSKDVREKVRISEKIHPSISKQWRSHFDGACGVPSQLVVSLQYFHSQVPVSWLSLFTQDDSSRNGK
jgi:hypothetical protein